MVDADTDLVHFFKKTSDNKPYQSLSLNNGELTDDINVDTDIIDEATGQRLHGFKFQFKTKKGKKKGKLLTVVPEQAD